MGVVSTMLGSLLSPLLLDHAVWAVKLADDRFLSERDMVFDHRQNDFTLRDDDTLHLSLEEQAKRRANPQINRRPIDWYDDLVATGDVLKVKELWLLCPPGPIVNGRIHNPFGSTAKLFITEPGTAFQFKTKHLHMGAGTAVYDQIIGRVIDKVSGDCEYFVWDAALHAMSTPMRNNVNNFQTWREGIGSPGPLSHQVLGFKLD